MRTSRVTVRTEEAPPSPTQVVLTSLFIHDEAAQLEKAVKVNTRRHTRKKKRTHTDRALDSAVDVSSVLKSMIIYIGR